MTSPTMIQSILSEFVQKTHLINDTHEALNRLQRSLLESLKAKKVYLTQLQTLTIDVTSEGKRYAVTVSRNDDTNGFNIVWTPILDI